KRSSTARGVCFIALLAFVGRYPGDALLHQPLLRRLGVRANQEHLLNRPRPVVEALEPGLGRVLHAEARRVLAAADLDAARHDSADVGALLDDPVEDRVEPADAPVLSLDPAELHAAI